MGGTPRSSMLKGFPIFKQPFWGTPLTWETPNCGCSMVLEDLPPKLGQHHGAFVDDWLIQTSAGRGFPSHDSWKKSRACGSVEVWKCEFLRSWGLGPWQDMTGILWFYACPMLRIKLEANTLQTYKNFRCAMGRGELALTIIDNHRCFVLSVESMPRVSHSSIPFGHP